MRKPKQLLMPKGLTPGEAEMELSYRVSQGDYTPVETDPVYPTYEVTRRTWLGKVVDLGKRAISGSNQ